MEWLKHIPQDPKNYPRFVLGIVGILLVFFAVSIEWTNAVPVSAKDHWWWLAFIPAALGIAFTIPLVNLFVRRFDLPSNKGLQLIAWSGFDEPEVTSPFAANEKSTIDVLEYVRGVEKVTQLKYCGSLFDVIISDAEFLHRHDHGRGLLPLRDQKKYQAFWDKVNPSIASRVQTACGGKLGIPVRFGLNDIVINSERSTEILGTTPISSYTDLKLSAVLEKLKQSSSNSRIGLWNWYVTTIPILLLADGIPMKDVWSQPEYNIEMLKDLILSNADHFYLFDYPHDATKYLIEGLVWTVLGSGGWILPRELTRREGTEVILPKEGAMMWIECAAIINNSEKTDESSRHFIEYLLELSTQRLLAERQAYRACPVTQEALESLVHDSANLFHVDRIFDKSKGWKLKDDIVLRRLPVTPIDWRIWEKHWQEIDDTLQHV